MLGPIMIIGILIGLLELLICVFIAASIKSKSKSNIEEKPKGNAGNRTETHPVSEILERDLKNCERACYQNSTFCPC